MEFFKRAEIFRLKSGHHDKYLVVNQDEETVAQSSVRDSTKACWAAEQVEGKQNIIRLRNCHTYKYLACTDKKFLFGMTGKKVVQRLRLDATVEWEPVKEGHYVKFKSCYGTFLRANGGPPPYRNTVTHDPPEHWTAKENLVLWIVDIVKMKNVAAENNNASELSEVDVANEGSLSGHSSPGVQEDGDHQKSGDSESFDKLKSMLAALDN